MGISVVTRAAAVAIVLALTMGCGGNEGAPSGGSGGSGTSGSGRGTVTALIDGVAYTGTVNTANNTNGVINIASNSSDLTRSVNFAVRTAAAGTTTVASGNLTCNFIATSGTTVTGSWTAAATLGSGSVTISSLTSSSVSGTFNFMALPALGSAAGATGTKNVTNGTFTANF